MQAGKIIQVLLVLFFHFSNNCCKLWEKICEKFFIFKLKIHNQVKFRKKNDNK